MQNATVLLCSEVEGMSAKDNVHDITGCRLRHRRDNSHHGYSGVLVICNITTWKKYCQEVLITASVTIEATRRIFSDHWTV